MLFQSLPIHLSHCLLHLTLLQSCRCPELFALFSMAIIHFMVPLLRTTFHVQKPCPQAMGFTALVIALAN